jgi:hypothetical protein
MGKQTRPSRPAKSKGNKKTQEFSIMDCIDNKRKRRHNHTLVLFSSSINWTRIEYPFQGKWHSKRNYITIGAVCPARDETASLFNDPKAIKIPSGLDHHLLWKESTCIRRVDISRKSHFPGKMMISLSIARRNDSALESSKRRKQQVSWTIQRR